MSHSVSRKGGEGQEKEKPDPRKPGCAHKGSGSTGSRVGWGWGWGWGWRPGGRDTIGLHVVRAYIKHSVKISHPRGDRRRTFYFPDEHSQYFTLTHCLQTQTLITSRDFLSLYD